MSYVNILLYLRLLDQPFLRVGSLHQPSCFFVQHHKHTSQCADYVHACVIFGLSFLEESELPSLVHPQVLTVNYDLSLSITGSIDQIQACNFVVGEDEDGILEPWYLEHPEAIQPKQLRLIPLVVINRLQYAIKMEHTIIGVILDPYQSILKRHDLKLLILFLLPHLQSPLKVINSQDQVTLHMDQLVLCSCQFLEHPQLIYVVLLELIPCYAEGVAFSKGFWFGSQAKVVEDTLDCVDSLFVDLLELGGLLTLTY